MSVHCRRLLILLAVIVGCCAVDTEPAVGQGFTTIGTATTTNWEPLGGIGLSEPSPIQGSFVLPGTGMLFRLHHTAGQQYGNFPSYTSVGATKLISLGGGVWLIDGQAILDNHARLSGSFDSMWRWAGPDTVWGIGLGADVTQGAQQTVAQGVISVEMLRRKWGLRSNIYLPFDTSETSEAASSTSFLLAGTSIQQQTTDYLFREAAMPGIDLEFHRQIGNTSAELFAGVYSFDSDYDQATGYKLGLRGDLSDNFSANIQFTQDDRFDARVSGGLTWHFGPGRRTRRLADHRLTSPVRRNHYVAMDRTTESTSSVQAATDQTTGDPLHLFFASEGGGGSGSQASPTSIAAALGDANFGAGSVLVLLDAGGPLSTPIALTADRQQVLGTITGDLDVDLSSTTGVAGGFLPLSGLGGRPVLQPGAGAAAIRLSATGVGHTIAGFVLDGSAGVTDGIMDFDGAAAGFGGTDTLISDMIIRDLVGTGVLIRPSVSTTIDTVLFQNNGQDIDLNAANSVLRNIISTDATGDSISLANTTGTTTIENVAISNAAGSGVTLANAGGQVNVSNLDVSASGDAGFAVQGGDATIDLDSNTSLTDNSGASLRIQGGNAEITYRGAISQALNGAAVSVDGGHGGSLLFDQANILATGGAGLSFQDADGTYRFDRPVSLSGGASVFASAAAGEIAFDDLSISGSTDYGVLLEDHEGLFTVTGALTIAAAGGTAAVRIENAQAGSAADFGTATIAATGAGTLGIDLLGNDATARFTFADLILSSDDATGLRSDQGGVLNFTGAAPMVAANGGAAVDLRATSGQRNGLAGWQFSELTSANSGTFGVNLDSLSDDFQVIGGTSISNAAGAGFQTLNTSGDLLLTWLSVDGATTGLDMLDHAGSFTISGVELFGGSGGQIQNVGIGARLENVAEATLRNMNLQADTRGLEGSVTNGADSSISVQNSTVVAGGDSGLRYDTTAASSGTLSATIWNSDIRGQVTSVSAAAAGGDIHLTASENDLTSPSATGIQTSASNGASISEVMNENSVHDTSEGWVRDESPLLVAGGLGIDGKRETVIADPDVVYDPLTGQWHLYYFAGRATTYGDDSDLELYIQHATSADGTGWVRDAGQALSLPSDAGAWDAIRVETPSVLFDPTAPADRRFKLYYSGASDYTDGGFPNYQLGLAFSSDGSSFTRLSAAESPYGESGAVLRVGEVLGHLAGFDEGVLADPEIKLIDGTYNLWFSSFAENASNEVLAFGISHATSADGINWTAAAASPVSSLLWPGMGVGGQQPSLAFNSALDRWEAYFTSDADEELAAMPSVFNPSLGAWRATSANFTDWALDDSGRDFGWDANALHEQLGLLTGLEVVIVDDVRHMFYTGWSAVDPPPGFAVPTHAGTEPAVLTLLHATRSALED